MSCIKVHTQSSKPLGVSIVSPKSFSVTAGKQKTMDVIASSKKVDLSVNAESVDITRITFGLVCGSDIGATILCGSDGVLITIDGKYLIVRK